MKPLSSHTRFHFSPVFTGLSEQGTVAPRVVLNQHRQPLAGVRDPETFALPARQATVEFAGGDVFQAKAGAVKFGALLPYTGPYNHVKLYTDFNDGTSNHEALDAFHAVLEDVKRLKESGDEQGSIEGLRLPPSKRALAVSQLKWEKATAPSKGILSRLLGQQATGGVLDVRTFDDIPYGNIDYSAFTLLRLAGKKSIVIPVTDPGVGNGGAHDRSILVSKNYGTVIGPNNGSFGLLYQALEKAGEKPKLYAIDIAKVERFEQLRRDDATYRIPETFHGRDLFVIVAAAIAGGLSPENFVDTNRQIDPVSRPFAQTVKPLKLETGEIATFSGFQDRTFGNIKTSLTLTNDEAVQLAQSDALFTVINPDTQQRLTLPFKLKFSDVPKGQPVAYLGSSFADGHRDNRTSRRFVELAINLGDASSQLGLNHKEAATLSIGRVS